VGSRVGIAALAVRLTPAVVCGVALLTRNALARRGQAPGAPSDLLLSRFYADELSGPLVPPLVPLAAVVVALVVALTLGTGVAPVASALRAWKSASGDRRRMWFAVFTVLAVAVYVLAAARHTMVLNVAPKIHERYLFAVGPLLLALFVAKDSPAPGAVTAAVVAAAIVLVVGPLGHIALTSRTWVDAPSLTVPWQMRRMLGGGKVAALVLGSVALLVCAGVRRARGNGLRGFGWLAALLVLLNAGWYGTMYRHPWLDPVARLVRGVEDRLGPTGRVTLVVRDDAEALRLVSQYTKFWLDDRATVYWAGEGRAPWYADVSGPATEAARRTSASYLVAAPGSAALCPGARTVSDLGAGPTLAVEVLQIPPGGCGTE